MVPYYQFCYGISYVFLMLFVLLFSVRRFSFKKTAAVLAACCLLLIVLNVIGAGAGSVLFYGAMLLLQIGLVQIAAVFISEYRDFRSLFTGMMASNYVLPGVLIPRYLYDAMGAEWILPIGGILIHGVALVLLIKILRPMYLEIQAAWNRNWAVWCVMPAMFYAAAWGLNLALIGSSRNWEALGAILIFLLTVYLCYVLVIWLVWQLYQERLVLQERSVLESSTRVIKREFQELQKVEQQIQTHMKEKDRIMDEIRKMMEQQDYSGVKTKLEQMAHLTETHRPQRYCDNPAVNGVLVSYLAEAAQKQVAVTVEMDLPVKLRVPDWELAVVIANLLDNAIQACQTLPEPELRQVSVTARKRGSQILIEICNGCRPDILFHPETGLPVSRRGKGHGIGMQSVAYFMERHEAVFDCGVEGQQFFARMLL